MIERNSYTDFATEPEDRIAIIASEKDKAGMAIKNALFRLFSFEKTDEQFDANPVYRMCVKNKQVNLYTSKKETVYLDDIGEYIESDIFIFASKHESTSKIPSFSAHAPGNWGKAGLGGFDRELCYAQASYIKAAILKLTELNNEHGLNFDVVQECTHHGPHVRKPCFFIEIGSTEQEWNNEVAAEIIAKTIFHVLEEDIPPYRSAFGIGGLHTGTNFKKIILNTDIAVGHICPKYALKDLDKSMIQQAIEETIPENPIVIIDWKGMDDNKERIVNILKEMNIDYKKTKDF